MVFALCFKCNHLLGFEEETRRRDHEHRKRLDDSQAALMAQEMKVC